MENIQIDEKKLTESLYEIRNLMGEVHAAAHEKNEPPKQLSFEERKSILSSFLKSNHNISLEQYAEVLNISLDAASYDLCRLVEKQSLEKFVNNGQLMYKLKTKSETEIDPNTQKGNIYAVNFNN